MDHTNNKINLPYEILFHLLLRAWIHFRIKVCFNARIGVRINDAHHSFFQIEHVAYHFDIFCECLEKYCIGVIDYVLIVSGYFALQDQILIKEERFSLFELL